MPYVVPVSPGISFQDPHAIVENRDFVVLPRRPGRALAVALPGHAIGRAPDFVEKLAFWFFGRVIGAAAEKPDAVLEDNAAADHAATRPVRLLGCHFVPRDTVGRVPDVAV